MRFQRKVSSVRGFRRPVGVLAALAAAGLASGCAAPRGADGGRGGWVACVEPRAARIGAEVLAEGGNAVDAAVAVGFALAVTWPEAGNVGGGGFLLLRAKTGEARFIDYRETAPAAAGPDLFLDAEGRLDPDVVRLGGRPVGVPGTVAGLALAHRSFGRLPWSRLVEPAVRLAREGILVEEPLARSIALAADELARDEEARRVYLPRGRPPRVGERLRFPDLAATLGKIRDLGPAGFYEGETARRIVEAVRARGGLMTLEDLSRYRAVVREPLRGRYRGYEILAGPPPTSGGFVLLASLGLLERFDVPSMRPGGAQELHLFAESLKRAFLERYLRLGDPDFVGDPTASLLDGRRLARIAAGIDLSRATPARALAGDLDGTLPPSAQTTHFSIVDSEGNAVANTYTLEESFGAKFVAEGTGVLLNNELHDFSIEPGSSTEDGRIGTLPNAPLGGKRPLSTMCPAIVVKEGRVVLVTGSPGGRTIPSTVLRVVTAVVDHGLCVEDAVALGRVHHGLFPDVLVVEERVPESVRRELEARGHRVVVRARLGDAHSIGRDASGRIVAAPDDRRWGAAVETRHALAGTCHDM